LKVSSEYDRVKKQFALKVVQSCQPTPGQPAKLPVHLPLSVALLSSAGEEVLERVLDITQPEQTFVFEGVNQPVVPSLLRGFSAPVYLDYPYSEQDLLFLLAQDRDPFARWEASQKLHLRTIDAQVGALRSGRAGTTSLQYLDALVAAVADARVDEATRAEILSLPSQDYIEQLQHGEVHPDLIWRALDCLRRDIAQKHAGVFESVYTARVDGGAYVYSAQAMGRRALKNVALAYWVAAGRGAKRHGCN
jgi:aminopeptidase N